MKSAALTLLVLSLAARLVSAQDTKKDPAPAPEPSRPAVSGEALEAKFKATLTEAVMTGRWCMLKDGKLGPDKDEKYTITGVEKTGDSEWTISARIQYGSLDFVAPVPVKVKWAGDTPVIIVDNVGFPGTAKYSARVMIFGDTYAGTWSGGEHGGLMHGVITRGKTGDKSEAKPDAKK
jgi:hypothetical protein